MNTTARIIAAAGFAMAFRISAVANPPEYAGGGTYPVGRHSELAVPGGWYRGAADGVAFTHYAKGTHPIYLYTGKAAPPPDGDNMRCRVMFVPGPDYSTEEVCRQSLLSLYAKMEKDGYRRGEMPMGNRRLPCYLSPETGRTLFILPVTEGRVAVIACIEVPEPGARFPSAARLLTEGLTMTQPPPAPESTGVEAAPTQPSVTAAPASEPATPPDPVEEETTGDDLVDLIEDLTQEAEELEDAFKELRNLFRDE